MSEIIAGLVLLQPFGNIDYQFMSGATVVRTTSFVGDINAQILFGLNWNNDDDDSSIWWHK